MIRRVTGNDFLLITQTDHALLAGELAAHFGNPKFARPLQRDPLLTAVSMHDQGWPLHDDDPILNASGLPVDVFEFPRGIALKVWTASAERTAAVDPYAGLLVSLHSLSLSINATAPPPRRDQKFDVQHMQDQFAVNKFQHREVERQEQLRRRLKFNIHLPLKHGLAEPHASPEDDRLLFDFRLLQAMDLISLCLCCGRLLQGETNEVFASNAGNPTKLRLRQNSDGILRVDPWPFDPKDIELSVPGRRVANRRYESEQEFRKVYRDAPVETLEVRIMGY